jgi:hypothetical protein
MATVPKKRTERPNRRVAAQQIADLVVGAVEKKLANLPKTERTIKRQSLISSSFCDACQLKQ